MDYNALSDLLFIIGKFGIETVIFLLSVYTSKTIINNHNIKKDYLNREANTIFAKPDVIQKNFKLEQDNFKDNKYEKVILEFCKFLIEKYPEEYLINFYNNINELNVTQDKKIGWVGMAGTYLPISNRIKVNENSAIFHELFHMASCMYDMQDKDRVYCGFRQMYWSEFDKDNEIDIGASINEGYTELLTHRYFGKTHKMPFAYVNEINAVSILEKIIGISDMERLYFTANLPELISSLEKYLKREDIIDFITRLDIMTKYSNNAFLERNYIIEENVSVTWKFLLSIYTMKLKNDLDNKLIDEETFINKSIKHITFLKKNVSVGCYKYNPKELVPMLETWENILIKNKSKKLVK